MAMMAMVLVPSVSAWCLGPGDLDDGKYEMFGPHVKGILIHIYTNEELEWQDMNAGNLDIEDWPLTAPWYNQWIIDPRFTIQSYGGEAGLFLLDINNNETLPDGSLNPCAGVSFRQALAFLVNRTYISADICQGFALPMYTPVPVYMAGYVHPDIKPGGSMEALTYGGTTGDSKASAELLFGPFMVNSTTYELDYSTCINIVKPTDLNLTVGSLKNVETGDTRNAPTVIHGLTGQTWHVESHPTATVHSDTYLGAQRAWCPGTPGLYYRFPIGADGWRYWDKNGNCIKDAGEGLLIKFYMRIDSLQRDQFGTYMTNKMESELIKIHVDAQHQVRQVCSDTVMGAKNFHLYTGGWTGIGPDPDWLYDLFHSEMYWHPGKPPNYNNVHDATFDQYLEDIKFAPNATAGHDATIIAQEEFATKCFKIPLWCASGYKAYKNVPVEEPTPPENWIQMVNQKAVGVNSWWSTLNMMKDTSYYPPIFINYGFKSDVEKLNPVYAEWYWDWEVLGRIYDGGAARDPMTLAQYIPQLYKNWTVGQWQDPTTLEMKSKVKITLRPDLFWQDGHPITIADVYYTLVEMAKDLIAKSLPPPWWYPTVQYFRSSYIIDDYNMEILLDVKSVWAVGWVIGTIVLPKHIWKPIVDSSTVANNIVFGTQPDPSVVGSGPYRFHSWSEIAPKSIVLMTNSPNSIELAKAPIPAVTPAQPPVGTPLVSPGYWQYCPINVNVKPDNYLVKINIARTTASVISNITITLKNWWRNDSFGGDLIVNKYVWLNDTLLLGYPHDVVLHTSADYPWGASDVEVLPLVLQNKSLYYIKVAVHVKGPAMLDLYHDNPWISQWINVTLPLFVTIKQDITGSTIYDYTGFGAYPTWLKNEAPAPDFKVNAKDVALAAVSFGAKPGNVNWNSVADIFEPVDYKINAKDIASIAANFGYK
jgi:ABC-type oligopeptide transport system substrate-binding subunit